MATFDLFFTGKSDPLSCVVIGEDVVPRFFCFETPDRQSYGVRTTVNSTPGMTRPPNDIPVCRFIRIIAARWRLWFLDPVISLEASLSAAAVLSLGTVLFLWLTSSYLVRITS
jgi:hypothetical protein